MLFRYFKQENPFVLLTKLYICSPIQFEFQRDKSV